MHAPPHHGAKAGKSRKTAIFITPANYFSSVVFAQATTTAAAAATATATATATAGTVTTTTAAAATPPMSVAMAVTAQGGKTRTCDL